VRAAGLRAAEGHGPRHCLGPYCIAILKTVKEITFTVAATRQWAKLTPAIRKRVDNKLVRYATTGAGDVKSLRARP
jgi:hypothetical protein